MWREKDTNSEHLVIGFGPIDLKSDGADFFFLKPHSKQQCYCDGSLQHNYVQAEILREEVQEQIWEKKSDSGHLTYSLNIKLEKWVKQKNLYFILHQN